MRQVDRANSPVPLAGGVGGGPAHTPAKGQFNPRNTARAKELRSQATPAERRLWRTLSARKLSSFKFSRQMPVGPYFADFLCREAKLIIELDDYSHDMRQAHDARRDAYLRAQGFVVLRFLNEDVMSNLDGVLDRIGQALSEICPPPPPLASGRGGNRAQELLGISLDGNPQ